MPRLRNRFGVVVRVPDGHPATRSREWESADKPKAPRRKKAG